MKKAILLAVAICLSGCAQWNELSDNEKAAVIVSGAVIVGANIVKNSQGQSQIQCQTTRSLSTDCPVRP